MALSENEKRVLARAARILEREVKAIDSDVMSSPSLMTEMLKCKIGCSEYEQFGFVAMTNRHTVIDVVTVFRGDIGSCSVYPREIVKEVLSLNCAAVVLYHNHPSYAKYVEPSDSDVRLTRKLCDALTLIDVRVLDHIIVSGSLSTSLAERGLM